MDNVAYLRNMCVFPPPPTHRWQLTLPLKVSEATGAPVGAGHQ